MSKVEVRMIPVVCLAVGMMFSFSDRLDAQEQVIPPAVRSAMPSDAGIRPLLSEPNSARRPFLLVPLYVSFGIMQVLDVHSTQRALAGGGIEANPIVGGVVGSPVAVAVLKGGATAGIILLSEKVWKRNRAAAVVTMVAMNSAYAMVVSRNYSNGRR